MSNSGLDDLDHAAARSLRWLGDDPKTWLPERPGFDHDVVIVGGGQTGVAIAYGLRRKGISRTTVIDAAPPGEAGVWTTIARMNLLRTQKTLSGPEYGNAAISFRAWYETQHGPEAFDAITRIPRLDWAAYVDWYRRVVGVEVRHGVFLHDIEPLDSGGFRLHLNLAGEPSVETTRKVILATGFAGGGGPNIPPVVAALPGDLWAHTADPIDFERLVGRRVGVLGAGPSAFDAAAVALENGAEAVHLFVRRSQLNYPLAPAPNAAPSGKYYPGALENFHLLPDAVRWAHQLGLEQGGASTPLESIQRATRHDNFHIHLNAGDLSIQPQNGALQAAYGNVAVLLDFLIAGTGFRVDLGRRPELARFVDNIALWGDRFESAEPKAAAGARYPYLGDAFEFTARESGASNFLADIHCYNIAGAVSTGKYLCDVPSMVDLPRLVSGVSRDLFLADIDHHVARINDPRRASPADAPYVRSVFGQSTSAQVEHA
jgi:cation diffusion facilitator CzcD-associated flavoprotein CzcO